VVTGLNMNLTNELDGNSRAIGSRYIASLPEGKGNTNGEVTLFFEDLAKYNKWLNETGSTLKITFTNGATSIEFFFPAVKYFGQATPKIATTQGVVVPLSFRAVYDATELTDVKVTLINTEATI
ncbi:MAG: phage tail tube protein, partial [Sphingomicrobium sp.]